MLAGDPDILWFESDFLVDMPISSAVEGGSGQEVPWSVAAIGGMQSWAVSGDGQGSVDVYVLDTGVSNDDVHVTESRDFRAGVSTGPADHDGRGTHIAGIVAAVDDQDGLVGVAPGARVHNLKVLDDNGSTDVSVVIVAVEYITEQKLAYPQVPMVVNLSLGEHLGTPDYTALDDAVRASSAAGVVYVVAAGNDATTASNVTPAKVPEAITVGSHDRRRSEKEGFDLKQDNVALQVSTNGGATWTTLKTYAKGKDSGQQHERFDLTPYRSAITQIRFFVTHDGDKYLYVDNVRIEY